MFRKILIANDGSEGTFTAFDKATRMAKSARRLAPCTVMVVQ